MSERPNKRFTVVTAHQSNYPNPIAFVPGDRLTLGRKDDDYPGWIWVVLADGNAGWAPESYVRADGPDAGLASHRYTARELDTCVDERLTCLEELNGWLWVEDESGKKGWVPGESVRAV